LNLEYAEGECDEIKIRFIILEGEVGAYRKNVSEIDDELLDLARRNPE
jgi:hypothetical protein